MHDDWPPVPDTSRIREERQQTRDGLAALKAAIRAADWMTNAACRGMPTRWWYPERGESVKEAKAVCTTCPVLVECHDYAITTGEQRGIWGGVAVGLERRRRSKERAA